MYSNIAYMQMHNKIHTPIKPRVTYIWNWGSKKFIKLHIVWLRPNSEFHSFSDGGSIKIILNYRVLQKSFYTYMKT